MISIHTVSIEDQIADFVYKASGGKSFQQNEGKNMGKDTFAISTYL